MSNPRAIYNDAYAATVTPGEPYRPSNGTEGEAFMDRFCDECKRGAAFQAGTGDSCPIAAASMAFDIGDEGYPKEWQHGPDGQPLCTAFEAEGEERCTGTLDMFTTPAPAHSQEI